MPTLSVPANVEKYENIYAKGYNKKYPNLDLVRLEAWYFKKQPGHVLDYGCGTGTNLIHLLGCGYTGVGADAAQGAVEVSRQNLAQHPELAGRGTFLRVSPEAETLPFSDATFDYVVCMSVLSLLATRDRIERLVAEFHRVLKPGGKMIIDINGPEADFAKRGTFVDDDTFEYILRPGDSSPLRCYCPKNKEVFGALFDAFVIDDLGHVSFQYVGNDSLEFIACVSKP